MRSLVSVRLRYIGIPICMVLAVVVASRLHWPGSEGDIPQALGQQRAKWVARNTAQYILTVNHTSATNPTWFTLSKIAGGAVENVLCRRYDLGGSISECAVTDSLYPLTVEQLFEALEAAYRRKYNAVEVEYDAQSGFPAIARFDPVKDKMGDEWGYTVELRDAAQPAYSRTARAW